MSTFFGVLLTFFMIGYPIFMIVDLIRKHKQGHKIGKRFGVEAVIGIAVIFSLCFITGATYNGSDDSDNEASKPRTHKVAKKAVKKQKAKPAPAKKKAVKPKAKPKPKPKKVVKKKPTKPKAEPKPKKKPAKKAPKTSKKQRNLALLKTALTRIPAKTHHLITRAYLGEDKIDVHVVLSDELLNESDAMLRKNCKVAWQSTTNIVEELGPYPNGDIDYTEPLVYVEDSSGDELAKTNMWGDFKWEGQ